MHSQLGPERAKLRVSGQNVRMGAACFPVLGVKSGVAKLGSLGWLGCLPIAGMPGLRLRAGTERDNGRRYAALPVPRMRGEPLR